MIKALIIVAVVAVVRGYPTGAPLGQCVGMTPKHNVDPQTSDPPFTISVNKRFYMPGDPIVVTLNATRPMMAPFKGFMLTARRADCSLPDKPVGRFSLMYPDPDVKMLTCEGDYFNNTVTHANRNDKFSKSFLWMNDKGMDVYFKYTMVHNGTTFWTNIKSGAIYDQTRSDDYTSCADEKPIKIHHTYTTTTMGYPSTQTMSVKWPVKSAAVKQDMSVFALLACLLVVSI